MKKTFFIFNLVLISLSFGSLVLAQSLDDYPAPAAQDNTQDIRNLIDRAREASACDSESTDTRDTITGESNSNPSDTCANVKKSSGIIFIPNVDIPGFFEGKQEIGPESIGLYINAVYKYGAGFAGIIAIFMIVFAAWQWIIAAGNSGKIENAKDTIIGALIGLALLFGGYLLLSQISSRLVDLKSLNIRPIPTRHADFGDCRSLETKDKCNAKEDCYWEETQNACTIKSMCNISIDLAHKNRGDRLLCCDGQFALKGEFAQNCQLICGQSSEEVAIEDCAENYCNDMDNQESSCKQFMGLCEWDEDDNTCDNYGGQRGNDGDDCDDPTDCLPGFCCDVDVMSANDCRPIGDPEANNCMPPVEPVTNCSSINSCEDYSNSANCVENFCVSKTGYCRWDDDWPQGCVAISEPSCGGNGECRTSLGDNNTNSQYCCCETYTPDHCDLRANCSSCQNVY